MGRKCSSLYTPPWESMFTQKVLQRWLSVKRSVPGLDYLFLSHSTKLYIGLAVCLHHSQITHSSSCFKLVNVCGREKERFLSMCCDHLLQLRQMIFHQAVKELSLTLHAPSRPPSLPFSPSIHFYCVCSPVYRGLCHLQAQCLDLW